MLVDISYPTSHTSINLTLAEEKKKKKGKVKEATLHPIYTEEIQ